MNKQDYVTDALKHLNSKYAKGDHIFPKLPFDCTQKFVREVQQAVDLSVSNNVIDESMAEMLVINDAKQGNIYTILQNKRMRRCGVAPSTNNFQKT